MSDRKNIIFDSQILNSVSACAQKTDLRFNKDLTTVAKNENFEEGDLLHQMKEMYNLALKQYKTSIIYDNNSYDRLLKACEDFGQWYSIKLELLPSESDSVIYQFLAHSRFTRMDGVEILEVERPYIINLYKDDELGVYYTGKIDRLTNTPNFGIVPRDYKKAKQSTAPEPLSNQFTGYCYATNSDVIIVDKVGFQKTMPPEKRFREFPLYYNAFKKEEWKQDTIWWACMYAFYIETNTWPRNRTACDKYSGCEFTYICDAQDEDYRQHIIKTKYIVGDHWDPTQVLASKDGPDADREEMRKFAANYGIDLEIE